MKTQPTIWLRRERSDDSFLSPNSRHRDIRIYGDPEAKCLMGIIPWDYSGRPNRRTKYRMVNCFRYAVQWLPDLDGKPTCRACNGKGRNCNPWTGCPLCGLMESGVQQPIFSKIKA